MVRTDDMAGHKGNFTGTVLKGYLTCFLTSMSIFLSKNKNRERFQWHWENGASSGKRLFSAPDFLKVYALVSRVTVLTRCNEIKINTFLNCKLCK